MNDKVIGVLVEESRGLELRWKDEVVLKLMSFEFNIGTVIYVILRKCNSRMNS